MPKESYGMRQLPRCPERRAACTAFAKGRCKILNDTQFDRPCPFYKTAAMIRELEERVKHG